MRCLNPVLRGMNADPSVCRRGDDYYLATSSFETLPALPVYHSRDLVNWRLVGHALEQPTGSGPRLCTYAPTIRFARGRFYLVGTDVTGIGNFVVSATEAEGPWGEPVPIDADMFDPSLCFSADGTVYYTRRGSIADKDIVQAEIDPDTGRLLSPLRPIATGFVSDDAEGPHLYEIGGTWYLLLAEGGSRALHMATIGRSSSPWGPFEPCPHNPFLAQHHAWWHPLLGAGHAELFEAHDGSWWTTFLATRHPSYDALCHLGRETFLAPVGWADGWPTVPVEATHRLELSPPGLTAHPWPSPARRDLFSGDHLDRRWVSIGRTDQPRWTLTSPGLALVGGPSWAEVSATGAVPTVLARRQEDLCCEATTRVRLGPEPAEAGLITYLTSEYHYSLVARRSGPDRLEIVLRKQVGDLSVESEPIVVAGTAVTLRLVADADAYRFEVLGPAGNWVEVGRGLTRLLGGELAQTWNGVLVGLWAGSGQPQSAGTAGAAATAEWFDYVGLDPGRSEQGERQSRIAESS